MERTHLPRRGITPVVAIVILLMMTVAIAGGFYAFSEGFFTDQLNQADRMQSADFEIKGLDCTAGSGDIRYTVQNSGEVTLRNPVDLFIYYANNDSLIANHRFDLTDFDPGTVVGPTTTTVSDVTFNDSHRYKVEFEFTNENGMSRSTNCRPS